MANKRRTNVRCNAKGYLVNTFNKDGTPRYLCRNHGAGGSDWYGVKSKAGKGGFKKPGYDDEDRIKLLSNLKQFKNKPLEYVRNYTDSEPACDEVQRRPAAPEGPPTEAP